MARIALDFKEITSEKTNIEGVYAELITEGDLSRWRVWVQGPEGTPFEGGIFRTTIEFPENYAMAPPTVTFVSDFFHPNVYPDGKVCISILHPPGHDELNPDERPEERWLPTHTPVSIYNCFLTLLGEPNIYSPANLDASIMWRDNREQFLAKAKQCVQKSLSDPAAEEIKKKLPHPDTDPRQRARRLKHTLDDLDTSAADYEDQKKQLEQVIRTILMEGIEDKMEAAALCQVLVPKEDPFGGDDGNMSDDGGELGVYSDDDDGNYDYDEDDEGDEVA